jgi:hypothetical protein
MGRAAWMQGPGFPRLRQLLVQQRAGAEGPWPIAISEDALLRWRGLEPAGAWHSGDLVCRAPVTLKLGEARGPGGEVLAQRLTP